MRAEFERAHDLVQHYYRPQALETAINDAWWPTEGGQKQLKGFPRRRLMDAATRIAKLAYEEDRDIAEVSCLPDLNDHMPTTRSDAHVR